MGAKKYITLTLTRTLYIKDMYMHNVHAYLICYANTYICISCIYSLSVYKYTEENIYSVCRNLKWIFKKVRFSESIETSLFGVIK